MKIEPLYARTNYLINAKFIESVTITEYDIRQANINILRQYSKISDAIYQKLSILPKIDREVAIGKMIREDGSLNNTIKDGIKEAKCNLFKYNSINDNEVLRIANDAVYVMRNSPLQHAVFDNIEFVPKKQYTLFARINNLVFFFSNTLGDIDLDVIGLGKDQMIIHADYMLTFIGNLFYYMESTDISVAIEYYLKFYNSYINRELPLGFYRELNPDSLYIMRSKEDRTYGLSFYDDDVNKLEIGYNANILRELYGFLTEMYMKGI